ncbi:hypothetical protein ACLB2K_037250 [Fragaria x ananassa]
MLQEMLAGEALSWFYEFPPNLVDCFWELADMFVNRFILLTNRQNTAQLFKVKQDRGEGLKAFMNQWQGATARSGALTRRLQMRRSFRDCCPGSFYMQ